MSQIVSLPRAVVSKRLLTCALGIAVVSTVCTTALATPMTLSQTSTQVQIANTLEAFNQLDLEKLKEELPTQEEVEHALIEAKETLYNAIKHYQVPPDVAERAHLDGRFPMRSPLTPGHVDTQTVKLPHTVPAFYVIGDDAFSITWLTQHKAQLKALHATGLITNIDSKARLDTLQTELGVTLRPVTLTELETYLPVQHYPFWFVNGQVGQ